MAESRIHRNRLRPVITGFFPLIAAFILIPLFASAQPEDTTRHPQTAGSPTPDTAIPSGYIATPPVDAVTPTPDAAPDPDIPDWDLSDLTRPGLFERKLSEPGVNESIVPGARWFPYPDYTDRDGWNALLGSTAPEIIRRGEDFLGYEWKTIPATAYLAFEREGDRLAMEDIHFANLRALVSLTLAELAEGRGRFIDDIVNGVWFNAQRFSWVYSAHQGFQETGRALPDDSEHFIDLAACLVGTAMSVALHFFGDAFDSIDPSISEAARAALRKQILDPFLEIETYHSQGWIGLGYGDKIPALSNWTPWCNADVMLCVLLVEDNPERLRAALVRSARSMDMFMRSVQSDGACEEGSAYWERAAGKLYEWLQILFDASSGRFDCLGNARVRSMGEFISRSHVGGGHVINFADASARATTPPELVYAYGSAVNSHEMTSFALSLMGEGNHARFSAPLPKSDDICRALQAVRFGPALRAAADSLNTLVLKTAASAAPDARSESGARRKTTTDAHANTGAAAKTDTQPDANADTARRAAFDAVIHDLRGSVPAATWYPETEICLLRTASDWFLAAKGGYNDESHNHNDIGSCILYIRDIPVLVDAGVGTYTAQTFGPDRYRIPFMQSAWHNLPSINGIQQSFGRRYQSSSVTFTTLPDTSAAEFSLDMAGAYPDSASCRSWRRAYTLVPISVTTNLSSDTPGGTRTNITPDTQTDTQTTTRTITQATTLTITDTFDLSRRTAPDAENFLVSGNIILPGSTYRGRAVSKGELLILCAEPRLSLPTAQAPAPASSSFLNTVDTTAQAPTTTAQAHIATSSPHDTVAVMMTYPRNLRPSVDEMPLDDPKLNAAWGASLRRLRLTSPSSAPAMGTYTFILTELKTTTELQTLTELQTTDPCADCVISGVLDRLPTDDSELFTSLMAELAAVPEESVLAIASMLEPPAWDSNYIYETALNGLVAYATLPGRRTLATALRRALSEAASACPDPDNRAYLSSLASSLEPLAAPASGSSR